MKQATFDFTFIESILDRMMIPAYKEQMVQSYKELWDDSDEIGRQNMVINFVAASMVFTKEV